MHCFLASGGLVIFQIQIYLVYVVNNAVAV